MTDSGTTPSASDPSKPAPRRAAVSQQTNVQETIESILVAFILAFIFRAFVVEAFVIPTGSMAPTLLGAHMRFFCPDCGYKFTANYSSPRSESDDVFIPAQAEGVRGPRGTEPRVYPIHCPNCGYKLPKVDPQRPTNDATSPPVHHGDRILVMKYLYLFNEPQRWDVVVFKSPDSPELHDYTQNYIKRLVGKPNEVVMILDGDIYVAPNTGTPPAPADFVVQTKTARVQDALWRVVYDNDFHPSGETRARDWRQPWAPTEGAGWNLSLNGGRTFRFDTDSGTNRGTLHFDAAAMPETFPFQDFLGYDQTYWDRNLLNVAARGDLWDAPLMPPRHTVADLQLSVVYERQAGDGPLRLRLSKERDVFTAEVLPDRVRLLRATDGGEPTLVGEKSMSLDGKVRVALQNVDYRASIIVNGQEVVATGADYAPNVEALITAGGGRIKPLPTAEIEAVDQTCDVSHVGLHRDIHYINAGPSNELARPWGNPRSPIFLGPDEYFVCGDNSLISGDARVWSSPINLPGEDLVVEAGRVPGRFMLGKAFFVYWPAGYKPLPGLPGLAPNFGEMRFIH
ncbi:MAG TPA: S26 family signal peptidase [Tepidisphaeraceae bacterium]|jgi:signal peptidase I|nr:S26 family signal peptidase [Tepidisphaeraceae bacterium]